MDKKFIKSMVTAIVGLGLISSCSMIKSKDSHKCAGSKKESNNCGAKNGCSAAKVEAPKTTKTETVKTSKAKGKKTVKAVKTTETTTEKN